MINKWYMRKTCKIRHANSKKFWFWHVLLFVLNFIKIKAAEWKISHKFNSKWELTKTWVTDSADPGFVISCAYGFDTFLVNEDYVTSCKSTLLSHEAAVKNSNGKSVCTGLYRPGYTSSKADVKHTGSNVTYYMATAAVLD